MVVDNAGFDLSGPSHDEGNPDAALIALALQSPQLPVTTEELRVGAAFLMRSVVAAEDDDGVVVESALLQLRHDLPHVGVEPGDHRGKLGMGVRHRVIPAGLVAAPRLVVEEPLLIELQDGVVGLGKLRMGKRVGEESVERPVGCLPVQPPQRLLMNEVGRVLGALPVVVTVHRETDVLVQCDPDGRRVALRFAVSVQEVREIQVRLKLADVSEELVDATLVGRG